ncbi:NADase-type glycan-binding domain-containing protein [Streptomyces sp. NPDC048419]|uniref:NADase-type glycan-binding domain-containing protein n=1 Tax=Streptomyces sp. NPDC048419 TaxID=3365547 RepID=UPI00371B7CB2
MGAADEDQEEARPAEPEAEALVVPVKRGLELPPRQGLRRRRAAETEPAPADADQPRALPPQKVQKASPAVQKTEASRRLLPGDLICGNCGEGNPPSRKFCSRCGASLESAKEVPEPWWRRLRPHPKTLKAGERPGQAGVKSKRFHLPELRRIMRAVRWILGLTALIAALVFTLYAPARNWLTHSMNVAKTDAIDKVDPQYAPIRPSSAAASVSIGNHGPQNCVDGFTNTFWAAPSDSPDLTLKFTFESPTTVNRALIDSGDTKDFSGYDRPKKLHFVFSDGQSDDITLKDESSSQKVTVKHAKKIDWMEIHFESFYDSINGSGQVAITNMQFYTRK